MKKNTAERKIFDAVDLLTGGSDDNCSNGVRMLPINSIKPFHDHPFRLYEGDRLKDMVESVKEHGILNPVIVRKTKTGFEMLSGHNRQNAARIAGLSEIPAIVKEDISDDEAYVYVIETNVMQRSFAELLPSEKAAVMQEQYSKMCGTMKHAEIIKELEALNGQLSGGHNGHQAKSRDLIAEEYGFSSRNAARYLRINYLIRPFKDWIDTKRIALLAAVDLSYIPEDRQWIIWKMVEQQGLKLKPATTAKLRQQGEKLTGEKIRTILDAFSVTRKSGNDGVSLRLPKSLCQKYFQGMNVDQMTELVEQALKAWFAGGTKSVQG